MLARLAVLCAVGALADIVPPARPHDYDCALKEVAMSFATSVVINGSSAHPNWSSWSGLIHDGLLLGQQCNQPAPKPHVAAPAQTSPPPEGATVVYVSPVSDGGNDVTGDGSESRPFATLARALAAAPTRRPSQAAQLIVRLADGVFSMAHNPAVLSAGVHDWTTIEPANATARPVLTGAAVLSGLTWKPSPLAAGALMATLPVGAVDASQVRSGAGLTLTVNSEPYTLARWPNANPRFDRFPAGFSPPAETQLPPTERPAPSMSLVVRSPMDPMSHFPVYNKRMVDPLRWHQGLGKGGVVYAAANFSPRALQWADPTTAVYSHWDGSKKGGDGPGREPWYDQWMNYFYKVANISGTDAVRLDFGRGGWQGYNSDSASQHRGGFVFNVAEELDAPGEWFLEPDGSAVHVFPNATAGQPASSFTPSTTIAIAQAETVLRVQGTADNPVRNVTIRGITVTGTRPTVMDMYERPSTNLAGWSVHRGGAVFVEGAESLVVEACTFVFTGGNALVLSRYVRDARVVASEFAWTGDSGIVSIGDVHGMDGTPRSFVDGPEVSGCLFHDLGWMGKQISGYTQFATARANLTHNVMFNLPRSGWNLDDGFAGGHHITSSLGFAAVRESADHGIVNSWAREPLAYLHPNGTVQIQPEWMTFEGNLMIADGGTLSNFDPDDGSFRHLHTRNVLAYAGRKNYLGREKHDTENLFLFPDLGIMKQQCYFSDGDQVHAGWDEVFANNTCILWEATQLAQMGGCDPKNLSKTVTQASGNQYFLNQSAAARLCCGGCPPEQDSSTFTLEQWQTLGEELGSKTNSGIPTPSEVAAMARAVLSW